MHHRIASRDGQSVHLEEMVAALRRLGHQAIMVGPAALAGTGFGRSSRFIDGLKQHLPAAVFELLELAYSVVAFVRLAAAVRAHRPDAIYERFSLFLLAGIWVRRVHRVPLLLEVNAPLFEERAANDGLCLHGMARWAQRTIWRNADHVLPVSAVLGGIVAAYGVPQRRVTVIPNGIDPCRFASVPGRAQAKAAIGLPARLVLGFTGFLRDWNAADRMLDFVAGQPRLDLHVLLVGDGPARHALEDQARRLGVADRLTVTGVVARADVAAHVAAFDIAVIPGVTPYASPLKLFEYLQMGRAIVAPDTANIRELLEHGRDALLFDPADPGGLQAALLRLCLDTPLRQRLAAAAADTIRVKSLVWDSHAARVIGIAKRVDFD